MSDLSSPYDLILRDALIVDGTGAPPRQSDLAVRGDRIAALGAAVDGPADREIDLGGRAVSPNDGSRRARHHWYAALPR